MRIPEDTRFEDPKNPEFTATGGRLAWKIKGESCTHWTKVYTPSENAKKWDGAEWATDSLGSRHGGYSYAEVKVTGRKLTRVPGSSVYGIRVKVTTNKGTIDEKSWTAWSLVA